jgi:hypothetical protein
LLLSIYPSCVKPRRWIGGTGEQKIALKKAVLAFVVAVFASVSSTTARKQNLYP